MAKVGLGRNHPRLQLVHSICASWLHWSASVVIFGRCSSHSALHIASGAFGNNLPRGQGWSGQKIQEIWFLHQKQKVACRARIMNPHRAHSDILILKCPRDYKPLNLWILPWFQLICVVFLWQLFVSRHPSAGHFISRHKCVASFFWRVESLFDIKPVITVAMQCSSCFNSSAGTSPNTNTTINPARHSSNSHSWEQRRLCLSALLDYGHKRLVHIALFLPPEALISYTLT